MRKLDSAVLLERLDSTASSSRAFVRHDSAPRVPGESDDDSPSSAGDVERGEAAATRIALDVSIRFGRLGVLVVLAVSVLVALTITFHRGVVLGHFDPTTTNAAAQKRLLDDYNSYTGNVASLFGRPLELFVALVVHVLLLRVVAASLLRPEISWKMDMATLAIGAGVGYLISNGLNALNVQPQSVTIKPMISAADLSYVPDNNPTSATQRSSNLTHTISERTPKNPITNTVLNNLVLPRVPTKMPHCVTPARLAFSLPYLVPEYGISQRNWQSRLLREALDATQLRVVVNPSNTTAHYYANADPLPMSPSLAADLFLYSMFFSPNMFRLSTVFDFVDRADIQKRYPTGIPDAAVDVFGLVPPAALDQNETAQRQWFLDKSATALARKLNGTMNTSRSDVLMEFSHLDISPTMHFDALTIDIEVDPLLLANGRSEDKATRSSVVDSIHQCGPVPLTCMMRNPRNHSSLTDDAYDPPAQVQVFGACVSATGTESLVFAKVFSNLPDFEFGVDCGRVSNSSLMVVTVGKRFVADAVTQNKSVNASRYVDDSRYAVVHNLRRMYSFTMAKLSWNVSDLTAEYHAECAGGAGACNGLRFPLAADTKTPLQHQELIVGVDALPMKLVRPPQPDMLPRYLPLVQLHEPSSVLGGDSGDGQSSLAADPLLKHNVANITWDMTQLPNAATCNLLLEERLQLILDNHMYIEHGLQTAYTAATFFLLQDAVVKDVVQLGVNQTSLNFEQNTQSVALLASIPDQNAWLTLSGCAMLVLSFWMVIVWSWTTPKTTARDRCGGLGHVTTPHVIARVMLDSVHFPPWFLHRRLVDAGGTRDAESDGDQNDDGARAPPPVDGFIIDGLTLQPPAR